MLLIHFLNQHSYNNTLTLLQYRSLGEKNWYIQKAELRLFKQPCCFNAFISLWGFIQLGTDTLTKFGNPLYFLYWKNIKLHFFPLNCLSVLSINIEWKEKGQILLSSLRLWNNSTITILVRITEPCLLKITIWMFCSGSLLKTLYNEYLSFCNS